jgi:hypothetical protein
MDIEMPFVNERISEADYKSFGLEEVDKKYKPMKYVSSTWAIDRERNIHIRTVSRTVPPDMGPINPFHLFFWKSDYVIFECRHIQHSNEENDWSAIQEIIRLEIPSSLIEHREQIISDIKPALEAIGQERGITPSLWGKVKYKLELRVGV